MPQTNEFQAFAQRLRLALESTGIRLSPSFVANEFKLRNWGRSITPQTARNWLMGNSMPTEDKLADREMLLRYLALPQSDRKTIRDVVQTLSLAASVKKGK